MEVSFKFDSSLFTDKTVKVAGTSACNLKVSPVVGVLKVTLLFYKAVNTSSNVLVVVMASGI